MTTLERLKQQPGFFTDTYEPLRAAISPAPIECASWINALTPLGAPALRCQPYGVHYAFEECVLPLTNPQRFDCPPSKPVDWLRRVLLTIRRNDKPLKSSVVDMLAVMLAPAPRRFDGLPGYWPAAPNVGQTQAWAAMRQRDGFLGRAILAAVASDLQDHSLEHVSGALLRLHDHELPLGEQLVVGDPRRARTFQSEGRRLLSALGAWPWSHAPEGRLPSDWRGNNDFLGPLQMWHDASVSELERECRSARAAFAEPLYD